MEGFPSVFFFLLFSWSAGVRSHTHFRNDYTLTQLISLHRISDNAKHEAKKALRIGRSTPTHTRTDTHTYDVGGGKRFCFLCVEIMLNRSRVRCSNGTHPEHPQLLGDKSRVVTLRSTKTAANTPSRTEARGTATVVDQRCGAG